MKKITLIISLLLTLQIFAQEISQDSAMVQTETKIVEAEQDTTPEPIKILKSEILYQFKPGEPTNLYIKNLNQKIILSNNDIQNIIAFTQKQHDKTELKTKLSKQQKITSNPQELNSLLQFYNTFQNKQGIFIYFQAINGVIELDEMELRRILNFASRECEKFKNKKKQKKIKRKIDDSIEFSDNSRIIDSQLYFLPSDQEQKFPQIFITSENITIPLAAKDMLALFSFARDEYQKLRDKQSREADAAINAQPALLNTNIEFYSEFQSENNPGILLDSINTFIPLSETAIRRLLSSSSQDFNNREKLAKAGSKAPDVAVQTTPQRTQSKTLKRQNKAVILPSGMQFFSTFQDQGGPFLYLDSLNAAIPITREQIAGLLKFLNKQMGTRTPDRDYDWKDKVSIKYFTTNYTAKDLINVEISEEEAVKEPHFKVLFDENREVISFNYVGPQNKQDISEENLQSSGYYSWNLLLNKPGNISSSEYQLVHHATIHRDSDNKLRIIKYFDDNEQKIAEGKFTYNWQNKILEQHINFPNGGKLNDLHRFYFNLDYNLVNPEWLVKCMYTDDNKMSKLVVMDLNGNTFYSYKFTHIKSDDSQTVKIRVYDAKNKLAGTHNLHFDNKNILREKELYNRNGKLIETQNFIIDKKKGKLIVDFFDEKGEQKNRLYQDL